MEKLSMSLEIARRIYAEAVCCRTEDQDITPEVVQLAIGFMLRKELDRIGNCLGKLCDSLPS